MVVNLVTLMYSFGSFRTLMVNRFRMQISGPFKWLLYTAADTWLTSHFVIKASFTAPKNRTKYLAFTIQELRQPLLQTHINNIHTSPLQSKNHRRTKTASRTRTASSANSHFASQNVKASSTAPKTK